MREGIIKFRYFEEGDIVSTPEGLGKVVIDEQEIKNELDLVYSEVIVQIKDKDGFYLPKIKMSRYNCILQIPKGF